VTAKDFGDLVSHVKRSGQGYSARCPAHEDQQNSLSFTDGHSGLVVTCHTGCTIDAICSALGVTVASLFRESNGRPEVVGRKQIVQTYDYQDEDGRVLYQSVRYEPKGFAQRRPLGGEDFAWTLGDTRRVVYRLPQLHGQPEVIIVEGEKDADRLWTLGLVATTNAMGAGKWQDSYAEQLLSAGASRFIVIPDNDRAGQAHAAEVVRSLEDCNPGGDIRLVQLPGLPPVRDKHGEDVSDWLDAGHTFEELLEVIAHTPRVEPTVPTTERVAVPEPVDLTDLMARRYPDDPGLCAGGILIRRGLAVVGGAPKLGKSSLVKNLVLRRATGAAWLGFSTAKGRTLVVQAEIPEPELQKRLGLMLKDADEMPEANTIYFLTDRSIKLDQADGLARLRVHIERVRPDLLVIDPLARFMVGDESGTKDMGTFIAALDLLIQDYDLTVLLVHHTGKPGLEGREGGHRLRGSSALFAAADSVLMLDRADDGFKLSFELRHGKEPSPLYLTRTDTLWFAKAGPPDELLPVASLIATGPLRWGHLITAVVDNLGTKKRTAERLVDRAKKADLIAPDADGYYTATATYSHFRSGGDS
jgi:putative DNA primase/helicase